jgi:hypothetical protein
VLLVAAGFFEIELGVRVGEKFVDALAVPVVDGDADAGAKPLVSDREKEIVQLVVQAFHNKEIGVKLFISKQPTAFNPIVGPPTAGKLSVESERGIMSEINYPRNLGPRAPKPEQPGPHPPQPEEPIPQPPRPEMPPIGPEEPRLPPPDPDPLPIPLPAPADPGWFVAAIHPRADESESGSNGFTLGKLVTRDFSDRQKMK